MLGRLRMPLHECFKQFYKLTVQIFRQRRQIIDRHPFSKDNQATKRFDEHIKKLVGAQAEKLKEPAGSSLTLADPSNGCRT